MSDWPRSDASSAPDGTAGSDRDAKIEQLLLVGLGHYFAEKYEQAVNVWTRVLFLDRSHTRARAYIERARSALAERQRQSEELLQNGLAAFQRGEGEEARRLLEVAMLKGAPSDEALAVLDRLNRLEQGTPVRPRPSAPRERHSPTLSQAPGRAAGSGVGLAGWIALVLVIGAAASVGIISSGAQWRSVLPLQAVPPPSLSLPTAADSGPPIPLRGETVLARARALAAGGRLRDALAALDLVRPTDAQRPDADRLRADIQRQLIGLLDASARPVDWENSDRPLP